MTRTHRALTIVAAGVITLSACGSSAKSSSTSTVEAAKVAPGVDAIASQSPTTAAAVSDTQSSASASTTAAAATTAAPRGGGAVTSVATGVLPVERKVIVTVTMDLEVGNVSSAAVKAAKYAEGVGGEKFSEQTNFSGEHPSSTLVLKVPPDKVSEVLTSLATIGTVVAQTQQSADVTAQYVDLGARITAADASVTRVRQFLDRTTNVNELANLEAELTRRQSELEQLLGQKRVLEAQTGSATITVTLSPIPPATTTTTTTTVATTTTTKAPKQTVSRALHNGTHAVKALGTAVAIVGAYLLPWSPFILVAIVVLSLLRRRDRRRRDAVTAVPAPPSSPPAPVAAAVEERESVSAGEPR